MSKVFRKKTLIFDLDETLIHCRDMEEYYERDQRPDLKVMVPINNPDASVEEVEAEINV